MKWRYQLALLVVRTKFKILSAFSKSKAADAAFDLFCTPPSRHFPELPGLYTQAEQLQFAWREYSIRGFRWNIGGDRKILIIHGFQSSSVNFEAYVESFNKMGWEVLAFDAPAHGGSSGNRLNVLIYRDFLRHMQEQFGPFEAVVAHSLGGLALCLALEEWPGQSMPRVALIAPATETTTAVNQYFKMIRMEDKKVKDAFNDIIFKLSGQSIEWFSIRRTMQRNETPVLWIHDENDDITPIADAEKVWADHPKNLEIVRTKGLGHRKIYRDPAVMEKVIHHINKT